MKKMAKVALAVVFSPVLLTGALMLAILLAAYHVKAEDFRDLDE